MTICAEAAELIRQLRARVAELESDNARLVQCLDDYGCHRVYCKMRYTRPEPCTCGFDAARQRKEGGDGR